MDRKRRIVLRVNSIPADPGKYFSQRHLDRKDFVSVEIEISKYQELTRVPLQARVRLQTVLNDFPTRLLVDSPDQDCIVRRRRYLKTETYEAWDRLGQIESARSVSGGLSFCCPPCTQ
jgi:hypothetical protein